MWWRFYLPNHIVASQRCEDTREISEDDQNTKDYDPDKVILDSSAVWCDDDILHLLIGTNRTRAATSFILLGSKPINLIVRYFYCISEH